MQLQIITQQKQKMPKASFEHIQVGRRYSRKTLAGMWSYSGWEAIARGVVTPAHDNKIILFVTGEKRANDEQYEDTLDGSLLHWEGPKDHFAEQRMIDAEQIGDEIHLFYRTQHNSDFLYLGQVSVDAVQRYIDIPSRFQMKLREMNGSSK